MEVSTVSDELFRNHFAATMASDPSRWTRAQLLFAMGLRAHASVRGRVIEFKALDAKIAFGRRQLRP